MKKGIATLVVTSKKGFSFWGVGYVYENAHRVCVKECDNTVVMN